MKIGTKIFRSLWILFPAILLAWGGGSVSAAEIYCFRDNGGVNYYTNVPGPGRTKVRLPLIGEKRHKTKLNPDRGDETYEPVINSASRHFVVDADIVRAVIKAESNYNPRAVSPKGAMGLMQLMPDTAAQLGVDPTNPAQNIQGGVTYLAQMLSRFSDRAQALAAYNWGAGNVQKAVANYGGDWLSSAPSETRNYVSSILGSTAAAGNIEVAVSDDLTFLASLGIVSSGSNSLYYLAAVVAALGLGFWAVSDDE